jgi:hypothetical protein
LWRRLIVRMFKGSGERGGGGPHNRQTAVVCVKTSQQRLIVSCCNILMGTQSSGDEATIVAARKLWAGKASEVNRRPGDAKRKPKAQALDSIRELKSWMQELGHSCSDTEKIARPRSDAAHRSGGAVEGATVSC